MLLRRLDNSSHPKTKSRYEIRFRHDGLLLTGPKSVVARISGIRIGIEPQNSIISVSVAPDMLASNPLGL
jgi:hypothetical protein